MGPREDTERDVLKHHQDLCKALNLDKSSASEAWKHFTKFYDSYVLEGEAVHWLGCAVYVASRRAAVPTVGKSNVLVQGNLVNLVRLLKHINISLVDFFTKVKKWGELMKASDDVTIRLDQLERNFTVSLSIFKRFQPIFFDMFGDPSVENVKLIKSKKYKVQPANLWRIFEFTWTLFVCVKSRYPKISDDLVTCLHLLLACCDFIYVNALISGRKDIPNPSFPEIQVSSSYSEPSDMPCIIDHLCERHYGSAVEVKAIKEYRWKRHIKFLFSAKVLKGNSYLLCDVLESNNFEFNFKNINRTYDDYILSAGEFDERIFLGDFKRSHNITTNEEKSLVGCSVTIKSETPNTTSLTGSTSHTDPLDSKHVGNSSVNKSVPMTPLTGRMYLEHKVSAYEVTTGQTINNLQTMLCGREASPSEAFLKLIRVCESTPNIETLIVSLVETMTRQLLQPSDEMDKMSVEFVDLLIELAKKLFFKLMDSILAAEVEKSSFDANLLLTQEIFHKTLFACAMEIVLFSCDDIRPFPWILTVVGLTPYHFYRIIEIVVRTEAVLTREIVKHLNTIEETILESSAWTRDSPLWRGIIDSGLPVPSCEDVSTQPVFSDSDSSSSSDSGVRKSPIASAISTDKLTLLAGKESILTQSPGGPLFEKFLSPRSLSGFKRELEDSSELLNVPSDSPSSSKVMVTQTNGENGLCLLSQHLKENKKPKRTGAIALFFRKFYYLASVRMEDMCNQLGLTDRELRLKIWTCFELSVVNHIGLMLNRHLDQILMCAVYVICKIVGPEKTFTDVMKCYRNQPQAQSCVYRNVLVAPDWNLDDLRKMENLSNGIEERGDLIKFYNTVYVRNVQSLVLRFKDKNSEGERVVLSPLPVSKSVALNSPRRVSDRYSVFLRALGQEKSSPVSPNPLSYSFNLSQTKNLQAINNMVKRDVFRIGKKLLRDDDCEMHNCEKNNRVISRKVHGLRVDRLAAKFQ